MRKIIDTHKNRNYAKTAIKLFPRGSIGSILIQALGAVSAITVVTVLARLLGPDGYGTYAFAYSALMLIAIPAQIGLPQLLVRETSRAVAIEDWSAIKGLWIWGRWAAVRMIVLAMIALGLWVAFSLWRSPTPRMVTIAAGMALIPLVTFQSFVGSCVRGLGYIVLGQVPRTVVGPTLFVVLVLIFVFLVKPAQTLVAPIAMALLVAAASLAGLLAWGILRRVMPKELEGVSSSTIHVTEWKKAILPLAAISGIQVVNLHADVIILGLFRTDTEIGVFRSASQLAALVIFGMGAINLFLQPEIARLYTLKDHVALQDVVTLSARIIFVLAAVPFAIIALAGDIVLALIFGSAFAAGGMVLVILAFGQLVNAAFGSAGTLLNMTGNERATLFGMTVAIALNVVMNFTLIPFFGGTGAAVATATSYVVSNVILWRMVGQRLHIDSTMMGRRHGI